MRPPRFGNPYLDAHARWTRDSARPGRAALLASYGFAVPDERALRMIADHAPAGVVEIGAGLGYWARLLHERGVEVVAYDVAPPPSAENRWFADRSPWFPVQPGDERAVIAHARRTLLLVWPTRNEGWAADAAELHHASGGRRLVYVGEDPGDRTGDLRLHAVLGLLGRCAACAYGVDSVPCTCGVTRRWRLLERAALPRWEDGDDHIHVFGPAEDRPARRRPLARRRR